MAEYVYDASFDFNILQEGDVVIFNATGTAIDITFPQGVYLFECFGSSGHIYGGGWNRHPGRAKGKLRLDTETILHLYINPYQTKWDGTVGGGGGATDIRLIGGDYGDEAGLRSRIMVAGGSGQESSASQPGDGGGLDGGVRSGDGGHQTYGGGTFGFGIGSGSGDGYYGGSGRSGGSGFVSGFTGCDAVDINGEHTGQPIHYSGLYFSEYELEMGGSLIDPNGLIKMTVFRFGGNKILNGNFAAASKITQTSKGISKRMRYGNNMRIIRRESLKSNMSAKPLPQTLVQLDAKTKSIKTTGFINEMSDRLFGRTRETPTRKAKPLEGLGFLRFTRESIKENRVHILSFKGIREKILVDGGGEPRVRPLEIAWKKRRDRTNPFGGRTLPGMVLSGGEGDTSVSNSLAPRKKVLEYIWEKLLR